MQRELFASIESARDVRKPVSVGALNKHIDRVQDVVTDIGSLLREDDFPRERYHEQLGLLESGLLLLNSIDSDRTREFQLVCEKRCLAQATVVTEMADKIGVTVGASYEKHEQHYRECMKLYAYLDIRDITRGITSGGI
mgnify:FL=1